MSFIATATSIIGIAEEIFPEFFASINPTEREQLTESVNRAIGYTPYYIFADSTDQAALQTAAMREFSIVHLMLLDRAVAEQKHNLDRALTLVGKSIGLVAAAVPMAILLMAQGADEITP